MTFILLAASYLLGSTPTSYWVGRVVYGVDLREHGSGNLGATNAFRVLGWQAAMPVIVVDIGKGFVPVWCFPAWVHGSFAWTLAFGAAAIVGHVFSLWVRFKGGKGVATSAGVFLALAPWAVLGGFVVWLFVAGTTRYVSAGSIASALALPLLVASTPNRGGSGLVYFTGALTLFVVWAHRSNIRRLLKGEENRMGRASPGEEEGPVPDVGPDSRPRPGEHLS